MADQSTPTGQTAKPSPTNKQEPTEKGPNKVEINKANSDYLRGDLVEELASDTTGFKESGVQLLKFHGLYQQENRDERKAARQSPAAGAGAAVGEAAGPAPAKPTGRNHSFMLRTRLPGGHLTPEQYLVHDDLADRFANGTLRITTRQCFQFHGIIKGDLKATLQELNDTLITSLGACGDVVRNVVCCPAPIADPIRRQIEETTRQISNHLLPRTRAYHDLWLDPETDASQKVYDGEKLAVDAAIAEEAAELAAQQAAAHGNGDPVEPIYGKTYLPRKFKIAIAYPGDNCVDVYTQDIGLIALADGHHLRGYNVVVGGGMGMNHTKPDTFPRLGDPLGFITPDQVIPVVEEIVKLQRDYGNRTDRKHARMKYLVQNWGIDRFRTELEARLAFALQPFAPMPPMHNELHVGWQDQGDGRWFLGLSIENGRIADVGERRLKRGLRAVVEAFRCNVRLTPNQDILLTGFHSDQRPLVEALFRSYGIEVGEPLSNIQLYSMACVALPTCGLAVAESERALPAVIDELEREAARLGLAEERISIRMTGCPNGCARPYVADIAFVGRSMDQYLVLVGGQSNGTRLNTPYKDLVHTRDLVAEVTALLVHYKEARHRQETLGDFCLRVGVDALRTHADSYLAAATPNATHLAPPTGATSTTQESSHDRIATN